MDTKRILIIGGGFAGLNAVKVLAGKIGLQVTLIDRNNFHLFQPLLYQVAMAGLNPSDIAVPIRTLFSKYDNVQVVNAEVFSIDKQNNKVATDQGEFGFDYLIMACGAIKFYFANDQWEPYAPSLKSIGEAIEIRERILKAFEKAEITTDPVERKKFLTFVVVGGGSTGVELAGALGEMCRYSMLKDFKNIQPEHAKIYLIEAGPRILPAFSNNLSAYAKQVLESLGVQVISNQKVTDIDSERIITEDNVIHTHTAIWAAGIQASSLNSQLAGELDRMGRIKVQKDLSLKSFPNIFVLGDQANISGTDNEPLPAIAPVALQQGRYAGQIIIDDLYGNPRQPFSYHDKGLLATIGRNKAIYQKGTFEMKGVSAWIIWLFIHIYYLIGFKNKFFVFLQWAFYYLSYRKGARLIVDKCKIEV